MKTPRSVLIILTMVATFAFSAEDHERKLIPGPKGGKVLETKPLRAEFFVQSDKRVSITFYDDNMKLVAPGEHVVKVIAEAPSGKSTLNFEKTGDSLISTVPLPDGEGYRIVVQIMQTADAKPQKFRIDYRTEICGECKLAEYACVCGHS
jgi:hypothetical protein